MKYFLSYFFSDEERILGMFDTQEDAEKAKSFVVSKLEIYNKEVEAGELFIKSLLKQKLTDKTFLTEQEITDFCRHINVTSSLANKIYLMFTMTQKGNLRVICKMKEGYTTCEEVKTLENYCDINKLHLRRESSLPFIIKREVTTDHMHCFYNVFKRSDTLL